MSGKRTIWPATEPIPMTTIQQRPARRDDPRDVQRRMDLLLEGVRRAGDPGRQANEDRRAGVEGLALSLGLDGMDVDPEVRPILESGLDELLQIAASGGVS